VLPIGVQVCTVEVVQDQRCALPSFGASRGFATHSCPVAPIVMPASRRLNKFH